MATDTLCNGRFTIFKPALGEGTYAVVYRAQDHWHGRYVALKVFKGQPRDPITIRHMGKEAQAIQALDHPNVVGLLDYRPDDSALVLELCGGTVRSLLDHGGLERDTVIEIGRQIAAGLAHAHDRDLVHRDVKPSNLLVHGNRYKVTDFGLVRFLDHPTSDGSRYGLAGTVPYMAPEVTKMQPAGREADVFSLAVSLFQCATGRLPFQGPSPFDTIDAIRELPPEWPAGCRVDRRLREVLELALEKDVAARIPDMRTLGHELERILQPSLGMKFRPPASLFGRDAEVQAIVDRFVAITQPGGRGGVVLVSGETGVGRTALCEEVARQLGSAACARAEFAVAAAPFAPLDEVFARVIPGWHRTTADRPPQVRLSERLGGGAQLTPFVAIVEDVHLAGPDALKALAAIAGLMPRSRGLLVLTFRSDGTASGNVPVTECLLQIRGQAQTADLPLGRLPRADIARLVARTLAIDRPASRLVDRVYRESEGNPAFAIDAVRYLRSAGCIDADGAPLPALAEARIPAGIFAVLVARIDRLPPHLRQVLEAAAIEGELFHTKNLMALLDASQDRILDWLTVLHREHGLIVEQEDGYRFDHGKIREAILAGLLTEQVRQLHSRLGDVLLAGLTADDPLQAGPLARHLLAAGRHAEAMPHLLTAARHARASGATEEAARLYGLYVAGLVEAGPEFYEALLERARLELILGDHRAARTTLQTVIDQASPVSRVVALATYERGKLAFAQGRLDDAEADFVDARKRFRHGGDAVWEAAAREARGAVLRRAGQPEESLKELRAALRQRRKIGFAEGVARSQANLGARYYHVGEYGRAARALAEARRFFAEGVGDSSRRADLASVLDNAGLAALRLGLIEQALEAIGEALSMRRRIGDRSGVAISLINLADAQACVGLPAPAIANLEEALTRAEELGNRRAISEALRRRASLHLDAGELAQARTVLDRAVTAATATADFDDKAEAALEQARLALEEGDSAAARSAVTEARQLVQRGGVGRLEASVAYLTAHVEIADGHAKAASSHLEQAGNLRPDQELSWRIQRDQAMLRGPHTPAAAELRRRATNTIRRIAKGIAKPAIRSAYLNAPERQALLASSGSTQRPVRRRRPARRTARAT